MKNNKAAGSKNFFIAAGVVVFLIVAFGVGASLASAATFTKFSDEFFIGGVSVAGKTTIEAREILAKSVEKIRQGVRINIPGHGVRTIVPHQDVIALDDTVARAKTVDERGIVTKRIRDWLGLARRVDVDFVLARGAEENISDAVIDGLHVPLAVATNARFEISSMGGTIIPSVNGQKIDGKDLKKQFATKLARGQTDLTATLIEAVPEITTPMAMQLQPRASALVGEISKGRALKIKDKTVTLAATDIATLLQPRLEQGAPTIGFDPDQLKKTLSKQLAPFEQEAKDAVFEYKGSRAIKFVAPQMGIAIDWDALAQDLFASLSTDKNLVIVATKDAEPAIKLASTNTLGINELIGTGTSDFSGSTANRIHNIETGMAAINGVLIAPGEEFSLMKTLGKIDGTTGYTQELVIKDNKTQPEYGGGLCQIGTTTFRAAMGAGFPILERRNHSYQVHYYFENGVSGTDATIYDPKPDFRFKNDMAHWVLLETRLIKSERKLEFRFWGTRDGRLASRTIPKILSTKPAPPKQLIQTTDLPVGKIKCTEKAHAGASTIFTYTVAYADGITKKQDFSSFYKPWAEVCLVGVAQISEPVGEAPAPAIISPDAAGATRN